MSSMMIRRALIGASVFAFAAPAFAAPAPQAAPATVEPEGNAIIVTATKREQTLQQVPVAVTVTTAETIQRAKIRDIKDLSSVVPSLRVSEHQSSAQTDFNIRGFGNGANNAGIEPSVGVFIDGVYRSRSAAQIADFPDVKRVEVLRGPQSTLFGKNASAGVISITTQEPQFKPQGSLDLSYGNFNSMIAKGTITGPISDTVAVSVSGGYNKRDGTVHDAGYNGDVNTRDRWFVRGQVLWVPDNGPRVKIIADYSRINENCCAVVNLLSSATTAAIQAIGGKVNPSSSTWGDVYTNFPSSNKIKDYGLSAQLDYALGGVKMTSITAFRHNRNLTNQDSDFTSADLLGRNAADVGIDTFTQELRFSGKLGDRLSWLAGAYYFNEKIGQTGQVLFGTQMRTYANVLVQGQTGGALSVPTLEATFGALSGNPALYTGKFFQQGTGIAERYHMANEAISVFGQADYKLTDRLTFTGGLNYTKDSKNFWTGSVSSDTFANIDLNAAAYAPFRNQLLVGGALAKGLPLATAQAYANANQNNPAANPLNPLKGLQIFPAFLNVPNSVEPARTSDGNLSFTARLAYDLSKQVNLYASVSTGFKASSINLSRDSRPALTNQAAIVAGGMATNNLRFVPGYGRYARPEKSTLYEAGLKANWGVASVNVAAFYQQIKDFQSNIFTGLGFDLLNADKESVYGFEFEGTVHPTSEITLSQAVTYLYPKYDSFKNSSFGDISGMKAASIPPISSTFAATWDHPLENGHHIILRGDWHYESPTQIEDGMPGFNSLMPDGVTPNYSTGLAAGRLFHREVSEFDASLTYQFGKRFEISAWGRNLTDNRYITVTFDSPAQQGSISGYVNQPRTYGVSALAKF